MCQEKPPISQEQARLSSRAPAFDGHGFAPTWVDHSVIALWLGHESTDTTQIYLSADLALKEKALAKTGPPKLRAGARFQPNDRLLAFLKAL